MTQQPKRSSGSPALIALALAVVTTLVGRLLSLAQGSGVSLGTADVLGILIAIVVLWLIFWLVLRFVVKR
jgi:hypothetical protein